MLSSFWRVFSLPSPFHYIQNGGKRKQRLARAEMTNREEEETRVGTIIKDTDRSIITVSLEQEEHELERLKTTPSESYVKESATSFFKVGRINRLNESSAQGTITCCI